MFSETRRQLLHIGVVSLAFLLRFLGPAEAMAMAAGAVLMNAFLLPRLLGRWVVRPHERQSPAPPGIVFYPLAVLATLACLPHRLDLVAGAWGILAAGDGVATLVGRRAGRTGRRWPWNPGKSLAGSLAFAASGSAMSIVLMHWTAPAVAAAPTTTFIVGASIAAAVTAMFVESLDLGVDDNLSVTFSAAAALWVCSLVDGTSAREAWPLIAGRLLPATALNAAVAVVVMRARLVDAGGAIAGAIVGMAIAAGAGLPGWTMLLAAFLAAALTSRFREREKRVHGIAEDRDGRRGAGNVIANCGVAAVAAILSVATPHVTLALLAMVTGLVAGASDTVASEVGKAVRGSTYSVLTLSRVAPGTAGAMSVAGTLAGVASACVIAGMAVSLGLIAAGAAWIVVVAATCGALIESLLAATFEARGLVTNDLLNFLNTTAAAAIAVALSR